MTQNIIRSGVPHAVSTSVVTHDAINPRNVFLESDKTPIEEEAPGEQPKLVKTEGDSSKSASTHAPATANPENNKSDSYTTNQHFAEPKGEIKSNLQKLDDEKTIDDNFQGLNSKKHLEDNRQKLSKQAFTDNFQKVESQKIYQTNRQPLSNNENVVANHQKIESDKHQDNFQNVDDVTMIEKILSFLEKKNIKDNFQRVDQELKRDEVDLAVNSLMKSTTQSVQSNDAIQPLEMVELHKILNSTHEQTNEDELRAKLKQMKEKLARANRSLIDIQHENDSHKDD